MSGDYSPGDFERRLSRLERQLDADVVLERTYVSDQRAIERRLDAVEETLRETARSQTQTYRAMLLMFLGVLIEAAVIAIKLG